MLPVDRNSCAIIFSSLICSGIRGKGKGQGDYYNPSTGFFFHSYTFMPGFPQLLNVGGKGYGREKAIYDPPGLWLFFTPPAAITTYCLPLV